MTTYDLVHVKVNGDSTKAQQRFCDDLNVASQSGYHPLGNIAVVTDRDGVPTAFVQLLSREEPAIQIAK